MELPGKDIYGVGLDSSIKKIQMDFRQYVAKSKGGLSLSTLKGLFQRFDRNGNGQLEIDEFERCLSNFGVFLRKYEYQLIFNFYDADKSGSIDFKEFLEGVKMPLNPRRRALVEKIFIELDRDGSGEITIEDIFNRVSFANHTDVLNSRKTVDEKMNEFIQAFEGGEKNGKVTLQEFLDHYQDLSMGISNDNYFIQLLEEQWLVSENDLQQQAIQQSQAVTEQVREKLQQLAAGNKDDVIIRKIFEQMDINKDGYIGLDEFQAMVQRFNIPHEKKYLTLSFKKIDTNHSGFIEFQEFFDYIVHGIGFVATI